MRSEHFRRPRCPARAPIALVLTILAPIGCAPESKPPGADEILETQEVGGAIDAELSTAEDPRGRRGGDSGQVLPAGFPAELPLPAGTRVISHGLRASGGGFVVLRTPLPPERLAADWRLLLEADGWRVESSGELSLDATRGRETVSARILGSPAGTELRIDY